jgi:hypothetical protein
MGYENYGLPRRGLNVKKSRELLCNLFHNREALNREK